MIGPGFLLMQQVLKETEENHIINEPKEEVKNIKTFKNWEDFLNSFTLEELEELNKYEEGDE